MPRAPGRLRRCSRRGARRSRDRSLGHVAVGGEVARARSAGRRQTAKRRRVGAAPAAGAVRVRPTGLLLVAGAEAVPVVAGRAAGPSTSTCTRVRRAPARRAPCPARRPCELLVFGDLPVDRRPVLSGMPPPSSGSRRQARPQHDAVRARVARGDAEREGIGGEGGRVAAHNPDRTSDRAGGDEEAAACKRHDRCSWNRTSFWLSCSLSRRSTSTIGEFASVSAISGPPTACRASRAAPMAGPGAGHRRQDKAADRLRPPAGAPTARCGRRRRSGRRARSWRRGQRARRDRRPAQRDAFQNGLDEMKRPRIVGQARESGGEQRDRRAACARRRDRA